ncbi:MAG: FKBP-type peptidyl-prolyl cis-trans isomerase [Bacteroidetes bacterium]|nr:FKBP-type peptidyl-prolyl cis-trans isomerase [Bacteroidota bacterium]
MKDRLVYLASIIGAALVTGCSLDSPSGPTFDEQLKKDKEIINTYIVSKGITAPTDPNDYGVRYSFTSIGTGIMPTWDDSVKMNYTLKLLPSETQIEKTTKSFLVGRSEIAGWQIGLPLINEGSKANLYIPSGWAYGPYAYGSIPANGNLIYEIELVKVISQLQKDTVAINTFLSAKSINTLRDPSGLRYQTTLVGTGASPTDASSVSFKYTGKLINGAEEGSIFETSTSPIKTKLSDLIKGLKIGMKFMKVGGKTTFYIPSTMAYGYTGTTDGKVPARANLIFEIELTAVE